MASQTRDTAPGDVLRRARIRRGINLERAAWDTRIAVEYLQALEEGRPLQAFPSPVYAKFFLREYAEYLRLPADHLVDLFTRAYGPVGPAPAAVLPPKYAVLGEEATRVPVTISPGRQAPIRRAVLPSRRQVVSISTEAILDSAGPKLRMDPPRVRPRRLAVAGLLALSIPALAVGMLWNRGEPGLETAGAATAAVKQRTLPVGGTQIFPKYRVVAFYGSPGTEHLGILGIGPQRAGARLLGQIDRFKRSRRPILPAFELIATIASSHPGEDGRYRIRQNPIVVQQYLDAARDLKALLILDVQPGRAEFMDEIRRFEGFLKEPDVGLALDPEWHVGANGVPGKVIGSVDAAIINRVVRYLSDIVTRYHLPQKLLIVHQFTANMVRNREDVKPTPQVAVTFDVDGVGTPDAKTGKYQEFAIDPRFHYGIKLYFEQDTELMSPLDVLNLYPSPELIVYQ
ncbi:MAG: helix-turn-helix domain-containing protein [Actinomycetota bacterium]